LRSGSEVFAFSALIIGIIVVLGIFGEAYKRRLDFKQHEMELLASQTAEKAAQYAAHTERLEARVQVLERIATDKGTDLAAQIEDLRKSSVN